MNVTGDYRALFLWEGEHAVRFYRIGTHSHCMDRFLCGVFG